MLRGEAHDFAGAAALNEGGAVADVGDFAASGADAQERERGADAHVPVDHAAELADGVVAGGDEFGERAAGIGGRRGLPDKTADGAFAGAFAVGQAADAVGDGEQAAGDVEEVAVLVGCAHAAHGGGGPGGGLNGGVQGWTAPKRFQAWRRSRVYSSKKSA